MNRRPVPALHPSAFILQGVWTNAVRTRGDESTKVVVLVVDAAGDEAEALEGADEEVALALVVAGDEVGGRELEVDVLALRLVPGPALACVALRLTDLHPLHGE